MVFLTDLLFNRVSLTDLVPGIILWEVAFDKELILG